MLLGGRGHGIVRQVSADGTWIVEKTVHNGQNSGLNRVVYEDKVSVIYNVAGTKRAELTFTTSGEQ